MPTQYVTTPDGTRLAYDVTGIGPGLLLLHGGGGARADWHAAGYVQRLQGDFTVIALDIRGHGESDKPIDPAGYTTDLMCRDILAVADACGVAQFSLWGFSYGGNIGRYLAAQSNRLASLVVMGVPFGPGASGAFRQWIEQLRARWEPIARALADGTLDPSTLTAEEQAALDRGDVRVRLAWLSAMLDWPAVEPAEVRCPTLWLVGSENTDTVANVQAYEATLPQTQVRAHIVAGLDHSQEFTAIDTVLPLMQSFTRERHRAHR